MALLSLAYSATSVASPCVTHPKQTTLAKPSIAHLTPQPTFGHVSTEALQATLLPLSIQLPAHVEQAVKLMYTDLHQQGNISQSPQQILQGLQAVMAKHALHPDNQPRPALAFDQATSVLITYGDQFKDGQAHTSPLSQLTAFVGKHLPFVSNTHLLPCFPYTSDDGFAVLDYHHIDPKLGDWDDVNGLAQKTGVMLDFVMNHVSSQSKLVKHFLAGDPAYANFFAEKEAGKDYSQVTRPRPWPLFHSYYLERHPEQPDNLELAKVVRVPGDTPQAIADNVANLPDHIKQGVKTLWTTFSDDQIDLNLHEPKVLNYVVDTLLDYSRKGANLIRLDAVGFGWKEDNPLNPKQAAPSMNTERCHALVQVLRGVLDTVAPQTKLITETNVPHAENVAYFGKAGQPEASMVYNFTLPPLTLHSFINEDTSTLKNWLGNLQYPEGGEATFFNFLASHDGIGMRPAEGILTSEQVQAMADTVASRGGKVNMRALPDGGQAPYELNANFLSALSPTDAPTEEKAQRMLAATGLQLSLKGVPGLYIHSVLGSQNDLEGMALAQAAGELPNTINRRINRHKFTDDLPALEAELADPTSLRHKVLQGVSQLMTVRAQHPAFSPKAEQQVIDVADKAVLPLLRHDPTSGERVLALVNVSGQPKTVTLPTQALGQAVTHATPLLQGSTPVALNESHLITSLAPYQVEWLKLT
jgi:glycosidase